MFIFFLFIYLIIYLFHSPPLPYSVFPQLVVVVVVVVVADLAQLCKSFTVVLS